jgi:hypothetical protein
MPKEIQHGFILTPNVVVAEKGNNSKPGMREWGKARERNCKEGIAKA